MTTNQQHDNDIEASLKRAAGYLARQGAEYLEQPVPSSTPSRFAPKKVRVLAAGALLVGLAVVGGGATASNLLGDSSRLINGSECNLNAGDARKVADLVVDSGLVWEYWDITSEKGSGHFVRTVDPGGKEHQYGLSCINSAWRNPDPEVFIMAMPADDGTIDVLVYGKALENSSSVVVTLNDGSKVEALTFPNAGFLRFFRTGQRSWNVEPKTLDVLDKDGSVMFHKSYES
jgi:hypothetical protein